MNTATLATIRTGLAAPHLLGNILSGGRYKVFPHVCHVGREIARTVQAQNGRLVINMGPGTGKSELISYWTPLWFQARYPGRRVIIGSASSPLATTFGGRVRNAIEEHSQLGLKLTGDTTAKDEWITTCGGGMKAVGVEKAVIGFRCHLFIIDDPYGLWSDAQSPTYRKNVADWYSATVSNRLEPGGSVIILHHRMHPQDLTNYVLTGEDGSRWKHISLPSLALENDPLGRKPGEAICPERFNEVQLEAARKEMRWSFEPMHQQNPLAMAASGAYSRFGQHNIDHHAAFTASLPLHVSVDFNISPGMHMVLGHFDPAHDQAWAFDEIHGSRMSVEGACAELGRRVGILPAPPSKIVVYGDPAGSSKWAGTGQSQYDILAKGLQPIGVPIEFRAAAGHPPVVDRVNTFNYTLRDIDGTVRYRVHPRCERLIRDFVSVQLDAKGGIDKSDQDLTHASDAEGYRIHELRGFGGKMNLPKGQFFY